MKKSNLIRLFVLSICFFSSILTEIQLAKADDLMITGRVLSPPNQPILSHESVCQEDMLYNNIDWPTDEGSASFDIRRNGIMLATGLTSSFYKDTDVNVGSNYTYQVIAYGPMGPGMATSEEISMSSLPECPVPEPPIIQEIRTMEDIPIERYGTDPFIESRQPFFSGKTNIPNAKIEIVLDGVPMIYQTIFANANGFWSWQCPETLERGFHTLHVTAYDIYYPEITASDDFRFEVRKIDTDDTTNSHPRRKSQKIIPKNDPIGFIPNEVELLEANPENLPFQLTVNITNFNHFVFTGENLSLQIEFSKKTESLRDKDYKLFYEILNQNNEVIYVDSEYVNILHTDEVSKKIPVSILAPLGEYHVRVKAYDGKILIAGENTFSIKELPSINIGFCKIPLGQLIQNWGWSIIVFLLILLFLLRKEHDQSETGIYQMTERYLKKSGFFSKKDE